MDKLEEIKKKIEELQTKSLVASDMKAFVTLVLSAVKVARDNSNQVSQETKDTLEKALNYLDQEHSKLLEQVSTSNEKRLSKIEKKILDTLSAAKTALIEVRAIKVVDGKDGAPGLPGEKGADGKDGSPDTGEEIADKLEALEGDKKLDFSALKNVPQFKGGKTGGVVARNIYQMGDVSLNSLTDGQVLVWDDTNKLWVNEEPAGGDTSGLVPYTGATGDVDLGANSLITHIVSSPADDNGGITIIGADGVGEDANGGYVELKPGQPAGAGADGYVAIINSEATLKASFNTDLITADQVFAFPDKSGTFAMLDDVGAGGTPGGSDTSIQFNDGGVFGGSELLTFDKNTGTITSNIDGEVFNIQGVASSGGISIGGGEAVSPGDFGGNVILVAGSGGDGDGGIYLYGNELLFNDSPIGGGGDLPIYTADDGDPGTSISISAGNSNGENSNGGNISLVSGLGTGEEGENGTVIIQGANDGNFGGEVVINGGYGNFSGGDITINSGNGNAEDSSGGNIFINAGGGNTGTGNGGDIVINAGQPAISGGNAGKIKIINGVPNGGIYAILDTSLLADTDKTSSFPNYSGIIQEWVEVPTSASATGTPGMMAYEDGFLYVCIGVDTWQRTVMATWI